MANGIISQNNVGVLNPNPRILSQQEFEAGLDPDTLREIYQEEQGDMGRIMEDFFEGKNVFGH